MILPRLIGHRGAAGLAPENTLASFRRAQAAGVAMVEFDVRLTADGIPIVFHDDEMERTTNGHGPAAALTLAAIKRLDAGSWFGPAFAGEPVATLAEVLELCRALGLAVNMEIKPDRGREAATAHAALTLAASLGLETPPLVSSFERSCLEVACNLFPAWPRSLLAEHLPEDWRDQAMDLGCICVALDQRHLTPVQVTTVRREGLAVLAYTVNDPARAAALWEAGATGIFSDFPDLGS
ncbi:Glycerophosphoryl diester phosphodiesterase [Candidatus Terasakiella magnetica]|nr:Glycerophosphoryl diester phosphodiesterase [Candidatus Terasakiella magnetica]